MTLFNLLNVGIKMPKIGYKQSEEHKIKVSIALTGIVRTPEHKANIAKARKNQVMASGEKHWNWKGGITPINQKLRKSEQYDQWRDAVYKRDNYTCVECGAQGDLQADHIKQFAFYPELRFDVSNGRTLCIPCHKKTPTYKNNKKDI